MEEEINVVVREEEMVPPIDVDDDKDPILRKAHFIEPTLTSIDGPVFDIPPHCVSVLPPSLEPITWPLEVKFDGWRTPPREWKTWVENMSSRHESTWKLSGIKEAILGSTFNVQKDHDLVLGLAERWCSETKSFVFPWGEVSVTLEDMLVFGFSVLGSPIFEGLETEEEIRIQQQLSQARTELSRTTSKKPLHCAWIRKFLNSGSEIEHEAFLALWLSRFVLPGAFDVIISSVFPIAIKLSRGTRVALGPAILAGLYRDLNSLKSAIVNLAEIGNNNNNNINNRVVEEGLLKISIYSPFQLLLIWAWERFPKFRPASKTIQNGEPRCAQWHKKGVKVDNIRAALDSSGDSFIWRPYAKPLLFWDLPKFYPETENLIPVDQSLDEDIRSFSYCIRNSELVGVDSIEQYLPHRVSMQFGFDQDLPGYIPRVDDSPQTAWDCYTRPIRCMNLYVPSQTFMAGVTTRYSNWWKQMYLRLTGNEVEDDESDEDKVNKVAKVFEVVFKSARVRSSDDGEDKKTCVKTKK